MPAPDLDYALGSGTVTLTDEGSIAAVRPRPGAPSRVVAGGRVRVRRGGSEVAFSPPAVAVDVDEVELEHASNVGIALVVRHAFAGGWSVRVTLVNHTLEPLILLAELGWVPAPACAAWALAAGATGAYAVPGPDGRGPLLGGELVLGTCDRVDERGIGLGRVELGPLARHVVQWRWDWYAGPRAFNGGRARFGAVPRDLVLPDGETARIVADDDEAVVAPGLDPVRRGGYVELASGGGHRTTVEVRSRRGTTAYALEWVEPLLDVLAALGPAVLAGPRSRAGVVRLPGVDAALVLQHLLRQGLVDEPEEADDALGLFVSGAETAADARLVALLVGEFERTGDPDLLDRAAAAVGAIQAPARGLGLAGAHVAVARLAQGRSPGPVLEHLAALTAATPLVDDLESVATALELRLTTAPRGAAGAGAAADPAVEDGVRRIGTALGAGLRGRPVRPLPVDQQAYLSVVLGLVPEGVGGQPRPEWGVRPHEVARTAEAEVVARLRRDLPRAAHGWLIMGARLA